jgi:hypothetical protein
MTENKKAIIKKVMTSIVPTLVRRGFIINKETDRFVEFLSDQILMTWELVEKDFSLDPKALALMLARRGLGLTKVTAGDKYKCQIALASLVITLFEDSSLTVETCGISILFAAVDTLKEAYEASEACGVNETIKSHITPYLNYQASLRQAIFDINTHRQR